MRKRAGLSQGEAGQRAAAYLDGRAISQSKVSRAEQGLYRLTPGETEAIARGCKATVEERRRLVALAHETARSSARPAVARNSRVAQQRIHRLEAEAKLIRSWQDSIVIGTVQTPAWTSAAFGGELTPAWWEIRKQRLALLDDLSITWQLVMSEAALRWNLGAKVMLEQIHFLVEDVSPRPNVQLGIVALGPVRSGLPPPALHLYDRHMAVVGTQSGPIFIDDPDEIEKYVKAFEQIETLAAYGEDARNLLLDIANDYRSTD